MEKAKITEVLPMITGALLELEQAKQDCKIKIDSAFETYDFTGNQEKAMLKVAKAKIAGKLEDVEMEIDVLAEMIGIVQEVTF